VSLILEALKKLEREKQTPDRGFLVMAQVPWAGEGRRGKVLLVAGTVVALVVVGLAVRWLVAGRSSPAPATEARPESLPTPPLQAAAPAQIVVPTLPRYVPPAPRPAPPAPRAAAPAAPAVSAPGVSAPPPLQPASAAPAPAGPAPLRLEAISEQDGVAVAVINGELVREGDHISGALVVKIGVQEVELEVDGRRSVLRF
jgi:hypothetical protein